MTSEEGIKLCESLLKSHFMSKGYSETEVCGLLDNINIVLSRKCNNIPNDSFAGMTDEVPPFIAGNKEHSISKRNQKYSVNGSGSYCKNGSALELVKAYLKEHPSTYHTIDLIFNGKIPNYVLSKEEVEKKEGRSHDRSKTKRWHKESPLVSSDGITFYVTTQVGDNCKIDFKDIVMLSEKLGYKIEPI